jgi:Spy/CpxP family protein refolding chaperone
MNRALKWKLAAGFVLVFIAGGAAGVFLGASRTVHFFAEGPHRPGFLAERMRARLRWQLHLTDDQMNKISPIIEKTATQLEQIRAESSRRVHETFAESHREMAAELTPEQRTKLQEMQARQRRFHHGHGWSNPTPEPSASPE